MRAIRFITLLLLPFLFLIKGEDEEHHKKQGECKIEKFKKCAKREQFIAKWVPL